MLEVIFDPDYEKNSGEVKDKKVFKVVERKFNYLAEYGLKYPSLNAKKVINKSCKGEDLWEFYITKKWRCFFTFSHKKKTIVVIKIANHH